VAASCGDQIDQEIWSSASEHYFEQKIMYILVKRDFERGKYLDHLYQGENLPLCIGFDPDPDSFSARQMY
jgi:hypothetical protein